MLRFLTQSLIGTEAESELSGARMSRAALTYRIKDNKWMDFTGKERNKGDIYAELESEGIITGSGQLVRDVEINYNNNLKYDKAKYKFGGKDGHRIAELSMAGLLTFKRNFCDLAAGGLQAASKYAANIGNMNVRSIIRKGDELELSEEEKYLHKLYFDKIKDGYDNIRGGYKISEYVYESEELDYEYNGIPAAVNEENTIFWCNIRDYTGNKEHSERMYLQNKILNNIVKDIREGSSLYFVKDTAMDNTFRNIMNTNAGKFEKVGIYIPNLFPGGTVIIMFINKRKTLDYKRGFIDSYLIETYKKYNSELEKDKEYKSVLNYLDIGKNSTYGLYETDRDVGNYRFPGNTRNNYVNAITGRLGPEYSKLWQELNLCQQKVKIPMYTTQDSLFENIKIAGIAIGFENPGTNQNWTRIGYLDELYDESPLLYTHVLPNTSGYGTKAGMKVRHDNDSISEVGRAMADAMYIATEELIDYVKEELGKFEEASLMETLRDANPASSSGHKDKIYGSKMGDLKESEDFKKYLEECEKKVKCMDSELDNYYLVMAKKGEALPYNKKKMYEGFMTPRNILHPEGWHKIVYKTLFKKFYEAFNENTEEGKIFEFTPSGMTPFEIAEMIYRITGNYIDPEWICDDVSRWDSTVHVIMWLCMFKFFKEITECSYEKLISYFYNEMTKVAIDDNGIIYKIAALVASGNVGTSLFNTMMNLIVSLAGMALAEMQYDEIK